MLGKTGLLIWAEETRTIGLVDTDNEVKHFFFSLCVYAWFIWFVSFAVGFFVRRLVGECL